MWLEVSTSELSDVLDLLPEISSLLTIGQAQLFFNGTQLTAKGVASSFEVNAAGEWWQVARVPMQFFYGLRDKLPDSEKIRIWRDGDKLWFNNLSVTAAFQNGVYDDYPLTLEAKLMDVLRARKVLSEEQLKRSGLASMATVAMMQFNDVVDYTWDKVGPGLEKFDISKHEFRAVFLNGI